MKKISISFGFIILFLLLATIGIGYWQKSKNDSSALANTTITGVVTKNYQGCSYDDNCVLTIQTDDGRQIYAFYGSGLTPTGSCLLSSGLEIVAGDQVELNGSFYDNGNFSLCQVGSYIRKR